VPREECVEGRLVTGAEQTELGHRVRR